MLNSFTFAYADDLDAFKQLAKSNAMILMDTSGSMSWPVYDPDIDYAAFMKWMDDQNLAYDDGECRDTSWWGLTYGKLDPEGIYLVNSKISYRLIEYKDSNNIPQKKAAIGDVMHKTSSSDNFRDDWLL